MWLAGVACPAYVIESVRPSRRRIGIAFVVAGALTLAFLSAQRERAQTVPAPRERASWGREMLVGGALATSVAHRAETYTVPGAVAWLLIWAALMEERREERGPWILALIPLVLVGLIFALGPIGPRDAAAAATAASHARTGLAIFVGVIVAYVAGVLFYWRLRRG
jgi:hypothetical protein